MLVAAASTRTSNYWLDVFPGITVFGLGLALMVAPLTATVLAAAPDDKAGIASGINNAIARAGSLMAVAALPTAVGLSGDEYADPRGLRCGVPDRDAGLRGAARTRRRRVVADDPARAAGLISPTGSDAFEDPGRLVTAR